MTSERAVLIAVSLLAGIIVAGVTWFTWELAQNLKTALSRKKNRVAEAEAFEPGDASKTTTPER